MHLCWVVDDADDYAATAAGFLAQGAAAGRKTVAFGPEGSRVMADLATRAAGTADPRIAFLDEGPLDSETMFSMFREQSAGARAEGYTGLCLVADMDWLLPARPTVEAVVDFELHLDRVVAELDATVVCAYRRSSFDADALAGLSAVHPDECGDGAAPQFRLVAGDDGCWRLTGEVDLAVRSAFATAFRSAVSDGDCVVDVAHLEFIDVDGMRTIAACARSGDRTVRLRGARPLLQRSWTVTGFDRLAPQVVLA